MPRSLDALQGLLGGGSRRRGNGLTVVPVDQWNPNDLSQVPDLSQASGLGLQEAGRQYANVRKARMRQQEHDDLLTKFAPNDYAGRLTQSIVNQHYRAMERDDPFWTPFLGALNANEDRAGAEGKTSRIDLSGIGQRGFRIEAPGEMPREFSTSTFENSTRDPNDPTGFAEGSPARRSGLSTQALQLLARGVR